MAIQLDLFHPPRKLFSIATTPEIMKHLRNGQPVAIGVSGGKDSTAAAYATVRYLDQIGHQGSRILVHSDLGRVEWQDSLPTCERLAKRLGLELVVVRRQAGDMMDRWLSRWANNVERYQTLACVKLILPWSTPSMRFCTSELKNAIIARELVRRFPRRTILSVTGIRREESANRAKMPVAKADKRLSNLTHMTDGLQWNPIIDWTLNEEVWPLHHENDLPIHEAYTTFGASRVSCCFCIMSTGVDILAALDDQRNQDLYREMVSLELESAFSFQDDYWLADARPDLLTPGMRQMIAGAKRAALARTSMEARIPDHLLYTEGWPTQMPTHAEAVLLAEVRRQVGTLMHLEMQYTDPNAILDRYAELMAANADRKFLADWAEAKRELKAYNLSLEVIE